MPTADKLDINYLNDSPSIPQKRKLAICALQPLDEDATANLTDCLRETTESHSFLKNTNPKELMAELEKVDADLVLLTNPSWQPSTKEIGDLILGYEMGSRITIGIRPKEFRPPNSILTLQKLFLYIFFGAKRQDPDTPLRLYGKEAFMHILGVLENYQNTFPEDLYPLSAVEYYFKFNTIEVPTSGWKEKPIYPQLDLLKMFNLSNNLKNAIRIYRSQRFS